MYWKVITIHQFPLYMKLYTTIQLLA